MKKWIDEMEKLITDGNVKNAVDSFMIKINCLPENALEVIPEALDVFYRYFYIDKIKNRLENKKEKLTEQEIAALYMMEYLKTCDCNKLQYNFKSLGTSERDLCFVIEKLDNLLKSNRNNDIPAPAEINSQRKMNTFIKLMFSIDELSEKFDLYIGEMDYYSAVKYYSDIVSKAPSWVPAWNFLGHSYRAAGMIQYAYESYFIGAEKSGREQNWYDLGGFCMENNLHIEACTAYTKVLARNPYNFGSYKNILYIFEKYINKSGNITLGIDEDSRLFQLQNGILEELVDAIMKSRESRDNKFKPEILCSVGMIFEARGNIEEAYNCYRAAAGIESDRIAREKLGIFIFKKGLLDETYNIFSEINRADPYDNIAKFALELIEAAREGKEIFQEIFEILKWYPSSPTVNDYSDLKNKFIKTGEYRKGIEVFYWLDKFYPSDVALCRNYSYLVEMAGMIEEAYLVTKKILMIKASPNTITIAVMFCIRNNMIERAESLRERYTKNITNKSKIIIDNMILLYKQADENQKRILAELSLVIRVNVIDDLYTFLIKNMYEDYIRSDRIIKIIQARFSISSENTIDKLKICLFKIAETEISEGNWETQISIQGLVKSYDEDIYRLSNNIHGLVSGGHIEASKIREVMELLFQGKLSEYTKIINSAYRKESGTVFDTVVLIMSALFDREGVAASLYQLLKQNMPMEIKIDILKKCIEVYPTPNYYAKLTFNYITNRQWKLAISNMNMLIKDFPESREADNSEKYLCWCEILMGIELGEIDFDKYKHGKLASALHYIIHRFESAEEYIPGLIDICKRQNNIVILNTIKGLMREKEEDYNDAYEYYSGVKELDEKRYIYNLNILHHKLKENSKNDDLFNKVSKEIGSLIEKYTRIGMKEQKVKNFEQAYRCYKLVKNLDIEIFIGNMVSLKRDMDEAHIKNEITEGIEDMLYKLKLKHTTFAAENIKKKDFETAYENYRLIKQIDENEYREKIRKIASEVRMIDLESPLIERIENEMKQIKVSASENIEEAGAAVSEAENEAAASLIQEIEINNEAADRKNVQGEKNIDSLVENLILYTEEDMNSLTGTLKVLIPRTWKEYAMFVPDDNREYTKELFEELEENIISLGLQSRDKIEVFLHMAKICEGLNDKKGFMSSILRYAKESAFYMKEVKNYERMTMYIYESFLVLGSMDRSMRETNYYILLQLYIEAMSQFKNIHDIARRIDNFSLIAEKSGEFLSEPINEVLKLMIKVMEYIKNFEMMIEVEQKIPYYSLILDTLENINYRTNRIRVKDYNTQLKNTYYNWKDLFVKEGTKLYTAPLFTIDPQNNSKMEKKDALFIEIYNKGKSTAEDVRVELNLHEYGMVIGDRVKEIKSIYRNDMAPLRFDCEMYSEGEFPVEIIMEYKDLKGNKNRRVEPLVLKIAGREKPFKRLVDPYSLRAVVHKKDFFGRKKLLEKIADNFSGDSNNNILVLHGVRRVGKTSILNYLSYVFDENYVLININLETYRGPQSTQWLIYNAFVEPIIETLEDMGISMNPYSIDDFKEEPMFQFRSFVKRVLKKLEGKKLIMMFDEFEVLIEGVASGKLDTYIFDKLRGIIQDFYDLSLIIAGADKLIEMLKDYASRIFNMTYTLEVSFLEHDEAKKLIQRPGEGKIEFSESSVEEILKYTNCHPFYTKVICSGIVNWLNEEKRNSVYTSDVDRVVNSIVLDTKTTYFEHIWNILDDMEKDIISIMASSSTHNGYVISNKELFRMVNKYRSISGNDFSDCMSRLQDRSIIEKVIDNNEIGYKFMVEMYRLWYKYNKSIETTLLGVEINEENS